jgi:hypothetical protein
MTVTVVPVGNLTLIYGTGTEVITQLSADGVQLRHCKFVGDGTHTNMSCVHDQDTKPQD